MALEVHHPLVIFSIKIMTLEFIELITEHYFIIFYLITLIVSVKTYRKYFDTQLRYFPIIIAYIFFNELLGFFIRYTDKFAFFSERTTDNDILFNLYTLVFFGYFYFVYYRLVQNKFKSIIKWLALFALSAFIVNGFFLNPLTTNLFYATCICSWILVTIIGIYFRSGKDDRQWTSEKYNLMFWVSFGLALFHFFFPILFLIGFLKHTIWIEYNLIRVLKILIVVMYSIFCVGLIISRRRAFR